MKNIVNIINFVRGIEPRDDKIDLLEALREELKLCRQYSFPNTVLFQYDATIKPEYQELVKEYLDLSELGLWLEVVKPLAEDAGLLWRGRWDWDWHNDVGFLIGYEPEDRKRLIDTAFKRFREIFGFFPKSVGSWHIDAVSLAYMKDTYGIKASCNCKDQYGTDGYTMWGGYYNGAYYPSKYNMFAPAQTPENQIDLPVFRMLGSDPIHQYDLGLGKDGDYNPSNCQGVSSLEPVYDDSGANREWVKWYFRENFNGKSLSFAYTQAGQENSFGWPAISKGLPMQFELLQDKLQRGEIELLTLGQSGEWFSERYSQTPAAAMCIDSDYSSEKNQTVWYYNKYYRANILQQDGKLWIRDLYLFDEKFREKYLDQREEQNQCGFYNLPVMDGFRFSSGTIRAGIYPVCDEKPFVFDSPYWSRTEGEDTVSVGMGMDLSFRMEEKKLTVSCEKSGWALLFAVGKEVNLPYREVSPKELKLSFSGYLKEEYHYSLKLEQGIFSKGEKGLLIRPENGKIVIQTA